MYSSRITLSSSSLSFDIRYERAFNRIWLLVCKSNSLTCSILIILEFFREYFSTTLVNSASSFSSKNSIVLSLFSLSNFRANSAALILISYFSSVINWVTNLASSDVPYLQKIFNTLLSISSLKYFKGLSMRNLAISISSDSARLARTLIAEWRKLVLIKESRSSKSAISLSIVALSSPSVILRRLSESIFFFFIRSKFSYISCLKVFLNESK